MNRAQRLAASLLSALAAEAALFLCFGVPLSGGVKWLPLLAITSKFIIAGWILSLTFVLPLPGEKVGELLLIAVAGLISGSTAARIIDPLVGLVLIGIGVLFHVTSRKVSASDTPLLSTKK